MKQSFLFTKTKREAPKDETSKNAQLLIRGGFIHKEMAGVYSFLPLGLIVLNKITQIIREEMNKIGGQEVWLSGLQDPEIWKLSGRWDERIVDAWLKTKLANGSEVGLALTHEEPLTRIMKGHINSYRDLPRYAYQFQSKFRNELRSQGGLLRTREFLMKDMYSFDSDQKSLDSFYEKAISAYTNVYNRAGIGDKTFLTFASGGIFSKYSHEFQTICEAGEDTIYVSKEKNLAVNKEVYTDEVLESLKLSKKDLKEEKGVEVGNIFKFGSKYSEPLGLFYTDKEGKQLPVLGGSYGIGVPRLMGVIVELCSDDNGIIWPENVTPFKYHLLVENNNKEAWEKANELYANMSKDGQSVLFDDREESLGVKIKDADLIGCPVRLIVSEKSLKLGGIEAKKRNGKKTEIYKTQDELLKNFGA